MPILWYLLKFFNASKRSQNLIKKGGSRGLQNLILTECLELWYRYLITYFFVWLFERCGNIRLIEQEFDVPFFLRRLLKGVHYWRYWKNLPNIPNFLMKIFWENFKPDFTIFLWQCHQSDRAAIGDFVWKVVIRFINFIAKLIIKVTKIIIKSL